MEKTTSYFENFVHSLGFDMVGIARALPSVIVAIVVLYVIYKLLNKAFKKYSSKLPIEDNALVIIHNIINIIITFVGIMVIAGSLGINTTSLVAAFSIFGLAVSLSLQNIMANAANAINLYANHPFKIGDYVDVGGIEGTVVDITFMFTQIRTYKNELIYIPNSTVGSAIIKNFSAEKYRRVEYKIGASYDNKVEDVKNALFELLREEELVVQTEDIVVFVQDYGPSSIDYTLRAYTKNENYQACMWSIKSHIKEKFDQKGISIPYPQLDVALKNN